MESIKINEIFYSLQGESSLVGLPTAFIRLTGCPMRCNYCDTAYAFHEGKNLSIADILKEINAFKTKYVTVTGGEPLAQKLCFCVARLMVLLKEKKVSPIKRHLLGAILALYLRHV